MKKLILIFVIMFLLTGCGEEKYDYICKKSDTNEAYKKTETLKIGVDNKQVYKFESNIKEEHTSEVSVNDAYIRYQNLYNNYNENNVVSEYKKNELVLNSIYHLDKSDLDNLKIELPYNFKLAEDKFIQSLKDMGYTCSKN